MVLWFEEYAFMDTLHGEKTLSWFFRSVVFGNFATRISMPWRSSIE